MNVVDFQRSCMHSQTLRYPMNPLKLPLIFEICTPRGPIHKVPFSRAALLVFPTIKTSLTKLMSAFLAGCSRK
jgi:hypothetical protein